MTKHEFNLPVVNLLIFTDLDGTLLDHDSYQFEDALPALARLQSLRVPIVPTTSKTLDEMLAINRSLNNFHPVIAENGGIIALPKGYFRTFPAAITYSGYLLIKLASNYSEVVSRLSSLRENDGFRFTGFNDMSAQSITNETGLSIAQAQNAKKRVCSEPILWQDSAVKLRRFKSCLAASGLQLIKGGRFWHVMGNTNKATAIKQLIAIYQSNGLNNPAIVALGDSPNDLEMLQMADTAIVIRRKDGTQLNLARHRNIIYSDKPGPAGWNDSVLMFFAQLQSKSESINHV